MSFCNDASGNLPGLWVYLNTDKFTDLPPWSVWGEATGEAAASRLRAGNGFRWGDDK